MRQTVPQWHFAHQQQHAAGDERAHTGPQATGAQQHVAHDMEVGVVAVKAAAALQVVACHAGRGQAAHGFGQRRPGRLSRQRRPQQGAGPQTRCQSGAAPDPERQGQAWPWVQQMGVALPVERCVHRLHHRHVQQCGRCQCSERGASGCGVGHGAQGIWLKMALALMNKAPIAIVFVATERLRVRSRSVPHRRLRA